MPEQVNHTDCIFCQILCKAANCHEKRENTILYNGRLFSILPCIGPLVKNHVLVVSKTHATCLGLMDKESHQEYNSLVAKFRCSQVMSNSPFLEIEHGTSVFQEGSASIIHTHIHWIPTMAEHISLLMQELHDLSLPQLPDGIYSMSHNQPYIALRVYPDDFLVFHDTICESQLMRRLISKSQGHDAWDWRKYPNETLIDETVSEWRQ